MRHRRFYIQYWLLILAILWFLSSLLFGALLSLRTFHGQEYVLKEAMTGAQVMVKIKKLKEREAGLIAWQTDSNGVMHDPDDYDHQDVGDNRIYFRLQFNDTAAVLRSRIYCRDSLKGIYSLMVDGYTYEPVNFRRFLWNSPGACDEWQKRMEAERNEALDALEKNVLDKIGVDYEKRRPWVTTMLGH